MKPPIRIALLWHMHQPFYTDPGQGKFILPWVRLHALKDYYGMIDILKDFPDVKLTFNLVPSLLSQLEGYLEGNRDLCQELTYKEAGSLDPADIHFLLRHFFSVNYPNHIKPYPGYDRLFQKRQALPSSLFSEAELRDLQVWFTLTHFDEEYKQQDERVISLLRQGEKFSEADKEVLKEVEMEILQKIIPLYRQFQASGQIEISTSPFFHPILPLLLDPQQGRLVNPLLPPYDLHFHWPADVVAQLKAGIDYVEQVFSLRPRGIWPPEGGLSEGVLDILEGLGIEWTATDESLLKKAAMEPGDPKNIYRPYIRPGKDLRIFFRDHHLSDLIGFYYHRLPAEEAARDLVDRIEAAVIRSGEDLYPVIPIILDGENAWEHYPGSGRDFLRAFYRLLSNNPRLHSTTFSQCLDMEPGVIGHFHPGSWVNERFDIWIGDEEDRRAWKLLENARAKVDELTPVLDPAIRAKAFTQIHIAQGSDWFWWFGKENPTGDLDIFDHLFRLNLQRVYEILHVDIPVELFSPVCRLDERAGPVSGGPTGFLNPRIDGRISSFYEWMSAGKIELKTGNAVMHRAGPLSGTLFYGFDRENFFFALQLPMDAYRYFADGFQLHLVVGLDSERQVIAIPGSPVDCQISVDQVVEAKIPISRLIHHSGDRHFYLRLEWFLKGDLFQVFPASGGLEIHIPLEEDYTRHWPA